MFIDLLGDPVHQLAGVLEGGQDLLSVAQPVCMDLQHGMEVLYILQVLLQLPLLPTQHTLIT